MDPQAWGEERARTRALRRRLWAKAAAAASKGKGPRGLTALRHKLAAYQRNGSRLGWLLIPSERAVEVWGPLETGEQGRRIEAATRLEGNPVFPGLVIDLEPIWASTTAAQRETIQPRKGPRCGGASMDSGNSRDALGEGRGRSSTQSCPQPPALSKGGSGTKQRQRAGDGGGSRGTNPHFDRLAAAIDGPAS